MAAHIATALVNDLDELGEVVLVLDGALDALGPS